MAQVACRPVPSRQWARTLQALASRLPNKKDCFFRTSSRRRRIMSTKKDMRRPDLSNYNSPPSLDQWLTSRPTVIPYQIPAGKDAPSDISGTLGSTLPMAAMFTRNKFIGWYADFWSVGVYGVDGGVGHLLYSRFRIG